VYLAAYFASISRRLLAAVVIISLAGCSYFQFPGVHKFHIQQGHIITQEMIDQLQPGMTRRQVAFVLGNPLLPDTFNENRWDYYYSLKRPSGEFTQKHLTVFFDGETMTHFAGNYEPTREGDAPVGDDLDLEIPDIEFPDEPTPQDY
jgi:outer membrane protein assembly factor BamE